MPQADGQILVVDDDLSMREFLSLLLSRDGYKVRAVASAEAALRTLNEEWPQLVLSDLNLPGMDGIAMLREIKGLAAKAGRDLEVVMVTAFGTAESAVEAMRVGAADYILKPFNNDELRLVVQKAIGRQALVRENARLRVALADRHDLNGLIGNSPAMAAVHDLVRRVRDTRINCLIEGESGTGKELVARAIHYGGIRADGPFIAVNCGAISEQLVESELFGHRRGAFTGAMQDKIGLLQAADGGTVFLDEVTSLPLPAQVTLLRAIQERRFIPVGDVREVAVDVRVIAASNVRLEDAVRDGQFREDLYYRLNVVGISIVPLRERRTDVPELVRHFVAMFAKEYQKPVAAVSPDAMELLFEWSWPGNVRELRNVIERAVALTSANVIQREDLPERMLKTREIALTTSPETAFPEAGIQIEVLLAETERRWLRAAIERADGNKTQAAKLVGLSFRQFRYRLAKLGLDSDE